VAFLFWNMEKTMIFHRTNGFWSIANMEVLTLVCFDNYIRLFQF